MLPLAPHNTTMSPHPSRPTLQQRRGRQFVNTTINNTEIKTGVEERYLWLFSTIFWKYPEGGPGHGVRLIVGGMGLIGGFAVHAVTVKSVGDI